MLVLWVVTPCKLVGRYQHFEGKHKYRYIRLSEELISRYFKS
jgi:hypothetical protein